MFRQERSQAIEAASRLGGSFEPSRAHQHLVIVVTFVAPRRS